MSTKYLSLLKHPLDLLRTKKILRVNPTADTAREEPDQIKIFVYDYHNEEVEQKELKNIEDCYKYLDSEKVSWINIDGIRKVEVENVCNHFGIHHLIMDDILSVGHRPKMDNIDGTLFCLLSMIYFNDEDGSIETEQISIVLGNNFVISFQEEAYKDVFDLLRKKIVLKNSKVRQNKADYLFYSLIDLIVDNYFIVMDKLGERIEDLEEDIAHNSNKKTSQSINILRKEIIILKRTVKPVRDLINGILKSESELIEEKTEKYFEDVLDHAIQASELAENYHDMMINLHDLYINNVTLKMNEIMKVLAIVTCLLAPVAIITGIFGMNFINIPLEQNKDGFLIMLVVMILIPIWMIFVFKKKNWF